MAREHCQRGFPVDVAAQDIRPKHQVLVAVQAGNGAGIPIEPAQDTIVAQHRTHKIIVPLSTIIIPGCLDVTRIPLNGERPIIQPFQKRLFPFWRHPAGARLGF